MENRQQQQQQQSSSSSSKPIASSTTSNSRQTPTNAITSLSSTSSNTTMNRLTEKQTQLPFAPTPISTPTRPHNAFTFHSASSSNATSNVKSGGVIAAAKRPMQQPPPPVLPRRLLMPSNAPQMMNTTRIPTLIDNVNAANYRMLDKGPALQPLTQFMNANPHTFKPYAVTFPPSHQQQQQQQQQQQRQQQQQSRTVNTPSANKSTSVIEVDDVSSKSSDASDHRDAARKPSTETNRASTSVLESRSKSPSLIEPINADPSPEQHVTDVDGISIGHDSDDEDEDYNSDDDKSISSFIGDSDDDRNSDPGSGDESSSDDDDNSDDGNESDDESDDDDDDEDVDHGDNEKNHDSKDTRSENVATSSSSTTSLNQYPSTPSPTGTVSEIAAIATNTTSETDAAATLRKKREHAARFHFAPPPPRQRSNTFAQLQQSVAVNQFRSGGGGSNSAIHKPSQSRQRQSAETSKKIPSRSYSYIEDDKRRALAMAGRKDGIFNKAGQLNVLTGADVLVVVSDPKDGRLHITASNRWVSLSRDPMFKRMLDDGIMPPQPQHSQPLSINNDPRSRVSNLRSMQPENAVASAPPVAKPICRDMNTQTDLIDDAPQRIPQSSNDAINVVSTPTTATESSSNNVVADVNEEHSSNALESVPITTQMSASIPVRESVVSERIHQPINANRHDKNSNHSRIPVATNDVAVIVDNNSNPYPILQRSRDAMLQNDQVDQVFDMAQRQKWMHARFRIMRQEQQLCREMREIAQDISRVESQMMSNAEDRRHTRYVEQLKHHRNVATKTSRQLQHEHLQKTTATTNMSQHRSSQPSSSSSSSSQLPIQRNDQSTNDDHSDGSLELNFELDQQQQQESYYDTIDELVFDADATGGIDADETNRDFVQWIDNEICNMKRRMKRKRHKDTYAYNSGSDDDYTPMPLRKSRRMTNLQSHLPESSAVSNITTSDQSNNHHQTE